MLERVTFDAAGGLVGALFRYDLVARAALTYRRHQCAVLAWGFGPEGLRLVVEGNPRDLAHAAHGLRVGTTNALRKWGLTRSGGAKRLPAPDLLGAVTWAHLGPVEAGADGPLASPWSSHRDLMRFRRASFYDAGALEGRVDPRAVHALAGGEPLPDGWPPAPGEPEDLSRLLRVAAAVLGVLPADRRCFRLFVHLARSRGWSTRPLADALAVTKRRIRQLATTPEPDLPLALTTLCDARLLVP